MPIVRSSFTPHGQNFKTPKIDFCGVITSVLYLSLYYMYCQIVVRPAVLASLSNERTAYCDQIEFVDWVKGN